MKRPLHLWLNWSKSLRKKLPPAVLGAALSLCVATGAFAQQADEPIETALVVVEGISITEENVAAILNSRRTAFGGDPSEARQRALDTLVAETALEAQLKSRGAELSSQVSASLLDARRQIIFQSYAQSTFIPTEPTPEEISTYVAENGHLFQDRMEYRFLRFVVQPRGPQDREILTNALAPLQARSEISEEDLDTLFFELAEQDIPLSRQLFWNGGEALEPLARERIEFMRNNGEALDISDNSGTLDVIYLFEARPAPVNASLLRSQIIGRIQAQRFQSHKLDLIKQVAEPYFQKIAASDEPGIEGTSGEATAPAITQSNPPRFDRKSMMLAALGLLGVIGALSLVAAVQWTRAASDLRKETLEISSRTPQLDRKERALTIIGICLALIAGATAFSIWTFHPDISLARAGILLVGGAVLGLLCGYIYSQSRPINKVRPTVYGRLFLWCTSIHVAVAAIAIASW